MQFNTSGQYPSACPPLRSPVMYRPMSKAISSQSPTWTACKYLLAFGLLASVVALNWEPAGSYGFKQIYKAHTLGRVPIRYGTFTLAVTLSFFAAGLTFCRWYVLVRAQGLSIRLADLLPLGGIGLFCNAFLLGSVGGDLVKATLLARNPGRRERAVMTVFFDRVVGLWSLTGFTALAGSALWADGLLPGIAARPSKTLVVVSGITAGVGMLCWLVLGRSPRWTELFARHLARLPRVGRSAAELWRAGCLYRWQSQSVILAVLLSWVAQTIFVAEFYLCAVTLAAPAPNVVPIPTLTEHFLIVPAGLVIRAVPLFPGAAGIAELGFAGLYRWFGYPAAGGVQAALVYRVVCWLLGLFGYLIYLHRKPISSFDDALMSDAGNCHRIAALVGSGPLHNPDTRPDI